MQTHKGTSRPRVKKQENEEKMGEFLVEPPESGDHMLAVKPWVGAIKPPSNPP